MNCRKTMTSSLALHSEKGACVSVCMQVRIWVGVCVLRKMTSKGFDVSGVRNERCTLKGFSPPEAGIPLLSLAHVNLLCYEVW